ncbi:MAG: hypothetical protein M1274_08405, partial [Actinobacteria bacterium]|nr:hypothetical protein [Actinomycetota bacterium]
SVVGRNSEGCHSAVGGFAWEEAVVVLRSAWLAASVGPVVMPPGEPVTPQPCVMIVTPESAMRTATTQTRLERQLDTLGDPVISLHFCPNSPQFPR